MPLSDNGKRAALSIDDKECTYNEQYHGASQQNISTISPICGVNPSDGAVLEIF
jgi:hypothetical protein